MSARPEGAAPAYDAAEKGTLEPALPPQALILNPKDEKKALQAQEKGALDVKEKPVAPKPAPKPKKKVSKWILWQLWFNTYRYGYHFMR